MFQLLKIDYYTRARVPIPEIQPLWFHHHFAIAAAKFAENPKGYVRYLVVWISKSSPQRLHQFSPNWLDMLVEKIGLQIINTKLQSPQTLANQSL